MAVKKRVRRVTAPAPKVWTCNSCGRDRRKSEHHWKWVYPDIFDPGRGLEPIAVFCPVCWRGVETTVWSGK